MKFETNHFKSDFQLKSYTQFANFLVIGFGFVCFVMIGFLYRGAFDAISNHLTAAGENKKVTALVQIAKEIEKEKGTLEKNFINKISSIKNKQKKVISKLQGSHELEKSKLEGKVETFQSVIKEIEEANAKKTQELALVNSRTMSDLLQNQERMLLLEEKLKQYKSHAEFQNQRFYEILVSEHEAKVNQLIKEHEERAYSLKKKYLDRTYKLEFELEQKIEEINRMKVVGVKPKDKTMVSMSYEKLKEKVKKEMKGRNIASVDTLDLPPLKIVQNPVIKKVEARPEKAVPSKPVKKLVQKSKSKMKFKDELHEFAYYASKKFDSLNIYGVKMEVSPNSGVVSLHFPEHYFDSNSARLTAKMREAFSKFIPIYAKQIWENKELAKRVESIDIIGHASPTYQKRILNPHDLGPEGEKAMKYNRKLSKKRAEAIKKYLFQSGVVTFPYQSKMKRITKTFGVGFMTPPGEPQRNLASEVPLCASLECIEYNKVVLNLRLKSKKK